jgi:hypothetical protein
MKFCPQCKNENPSIANYCMHCRATLPEANLDEMALLQMKLNAANETVVLLKQSLTSAQEQLKHQSNDATQFLQIRSSAEKDTPGNLVTKQDSQRLSFKTILSAVKNSLQVKNSLKWIVHYVSTLFLWSVTYCSLQAYKLLTVFMKRKSDYYYYEHRGAMGSSEIPFHPPARRKYYEKIIARKKQQCSALDRQLKRAPEQNSINGRAWVALLTVTTILAVILVINSKRIVWHEKAMNLQKQIRVLQLDNAKNSLENQEKIKNMANEINHHNSELEDMKKKIPYKYKMNTTVKCYDWMTASDYAWKTYSQNDTVFVYTIKNERGLTDGGWIPMNYLKKLSEYKIYIK